MAIKRGHFNLGAGIFRISAPNIDVDTAGPGQLLLDERFIYPQIIQSIYVPFVVGQNVVTVSLIDNGFVPRTYAYGRYAGEDNRAFPARAYYAASGGDANNSQNHFFYYVSTNQLTVDFPIPTFLRGAQIITMRP